MGKIVPMARDRRDYRNQSPPPFPGYPGNGPVPVPDEGPVGDAPDPPSPPPAAQRGSHWLKWTLSIAAGAVVGALAVDMYRKLFVRERNPPDDDGPGGNNGNSGGNPFGSISGAPQVMPFPMPLPVPMPMPMPGYGMMQAPAPAPVINPSAPLTEQQRLEVLRLEAAKAENEAIAAQLKAWGDGELD